MGLVLVSAGFALIDFVVTWLVNLGADIKTATGMSSFAVFVATIPLTITVALCAWAFWYRGYHRSGGEMAADIGGAVVATYVVWLLLFNAYSFVWPQTAICNLHSDYRSERVPCTAEQFVQGMCIETYRAVAPNNLPLCDTRRQELKHRYEGPAYPSPSYLWSPPHAALEIIGFYWENYGVALFLKALILGFSWGGILARLDDL
jgi:hypothetical protein